MSSTARAALLAVAEDAKLRLFGSASRSRLRRCHQQPFGATLQPAMRSSPSPTAAAPAVIEAVEIARSFGRRAVALTRRAPRWAAPSTSSRSPSGVEGRLRPTPSRLRHSPSSTPSRPASPPASAPAAAKRSAASLHPGRIASPSQPEHRPTPIMKTAARGRGCRVRTETRPLERAAPPPNHYKRRPWRRRTPPLPGASSPLSTRFNARLRGLGITPWRHSSPPPARCGHQAISVPSRRCGGELRCHRGEVLAFSATNGAGKSTLVRSSPVACGFLGRILFEDRTAFASPSEARGGDRDRLPGLSLCTNVDVVAKLLHGP